MTVEQLIQELKKLPPNVVLQDIVVLTGHRERLVSWVSWQGNRVVIEIGDDRG